MTLGRLRQMIIAAAAAILLAACATQPPYRAAEAGGYGYSERQLTEDQYRIHFRGRGDNTSRAIDYALLRASELTLEKGFDWFDIASRDTLVDREQVTPPAMPAGPAASYATVQDCGLLSCTTYYRPVPQYHSGSSLGNQRSEVEVIMDIRIGKGMRPSDQTSYDARELYSRLNPQR